MQTVTLSLFRFDSLGDRLWVLGQMAAARPGLARLPGLEFHKLFGSGTGEGFTPRPNWTTWAILASWKCPAQARAGLDGPGPFRRWRKRAAESLAFHLQPLSVRGAWTGRTPFRVATGQGAARPKGAGAGPLAALTRATVRPLRAPGFWKRVPDISARIGDDPNVLFKIGLGEVPLLHQVTFSIWPDARSMAEFAGSGPHADAVRAVRDGDWFSEELFARFRVLGAEGNWSGTPPLPEFNDKEAA